VTRDLSNAVVYQLYPRSFNDSDGDGIGDLPGALERLDHIEALDPDFVWLNPVYGSPQADAGYDVRDYYAVDDDYGTMADLEAFLGALHERDIRLVMDLVVNHTSDEHEWFRRSRAGDPAYADYYHWVEGHPDEVPNDWESFFGGPAWSYDDEREAWYLHLFDERQPDLNWRNSDVRDDVYEMMNWWLEKGIDGFRMDVINLLSKPEGYPDGDPDAGWVGTEQFVDGPNVLGYLEEMAARALEPHDAVTVGECAEVDIAAANDYVGPDGPLDTLFHFDHMNLDDHPEEGWWGVGDWDLRALKSVFDRWEADLAGPTAVYLGNHDQSRIVSRFGDDERYRRESATLLATFLLTMPGTPFCYQGDEFGMTNYPWSSLSELQDADAVNRVELALASGRIDDFEEVREVVRYRARDNARTPMQWDDSANAGFTTGEPWLPVNPNHDEINAEAARADPNSIYHHYRRLMALRDRRPALTDGDYVPMTPEHPQVWAYDRVGDDERLRVVLNWADEPTASPVDTDGTETLIENCEPADRLRPYEARVHRYDSTE
jgi:oligo-1,6-glucosidase/alpha-glucosidase